MDFKNLCLLQLIKFLKNLIAVNSLPFLIIGLAQAFDRVVEKRPKKKGKKTGVSCATVVWFSMGFHGLLNTTGRLSVT